MMMLSPRWGWSGSAAAHATWRAPSHKILVLVLHRENITAVGATPTPGYAGGRTHHTEITRMLRCRCVGRCRSVPSPLVGKGQGGGYNEHRACPHLDIRLSR